MSFIMKVVFYILSLWDKSRDDLLNEHRAYERQTLIHTVAAIVCLLFAIIISPNMQINTAEYIKFPAYIVERYIGFGAFIAGAIFSMLCLWNMVGLIYFRYTNNITD